MDYVVIVRPNNRLTRVKTTDARFAPSEGKEAYIVDMRQGLTCADSNGNRYFVQGGDLIRWGLENGQFDHFSIGPDPVASMYIERQQMPTVRVMDHSKTSVAFEIEMSSVTITTAVTAADFMDDQSARLDIPMIIKDLTAHAAMADARMRSDGKQVVGPDHFACGSLGWIFDGDKVVWTGHFQEDVTKNFPIVGFNICMPCRHLAHILTEMIGLMRGMPADD